jgi:hypothetical protein
MYASKAKSRSTSKDSSHVPHFAGTVPKYRSLHSKTTLVGKKQGHLAHHGALKLLKHSKADETNEDFFTISYVEIEPVESTRRSVSPSRRVAKTTLISSRRSPSPTRKSLPEASSSASSPSKASKRRPKEQHNFEYRVLRTDPLHSHRHEKTGYKRHEFTEVDYDTIRGHVPGGVARIVLQDLVDNPPTHLLDLEEKEGVSNLPFHLLPFEQYLIAVYSPETKEISLYGGWTVKNVHRVRIKLLGTYHAKDSAAFRKASWYRFHNDIHME